MKLLSSLLVILSFSAAEASARSCFKIHLAKPQLPAVGSYQPSSSHHIEDLALGFVPNPKLIQYMQSLMQQSAYKKKVEKVEGFNDSIIIPKAPRIEKLIRQETPYTVSLMGREVINEASDLKSFRHLGLVYGDPHFGNLNAQPNAFSSKGKERNRYTVVDLDEVAVGVFSLDLARYVIFLRASVGNFKDAFGKGFEDQLFDQYRRGLEGQRPEELPSFVKKSLESSPKDIRAKIVDYAEDRTQGSGLFRRSLFEKNELAEFTTKNMKEEFLKAMGFNRDKGDRKEFKAKLMSAFETALQKDFLGQVEILDVAIPVRDSGGSATMQRFLLSTKVTVDGHEYPMLVELKQNVEKAAWDAIVETPVLNAAEQYELALQATMDDPGPFLKVVPFTDNVSFLLRARGNIDIEYDSKSDIRELALFNARMMGLFHGGQGTSQSRGYVQQVLLETDKFQETIMDIAEKTLKRLSKESGLKVPKK